MSVDPPMPKRMLEPPQAKGHISVARLADYWYVACQSASLTDRPVAARVLGTPLVLFRDEAGRAAALLDRCAHRNVPLSLGRRVAPGRLQCAYHGWQFDGAGVCQLIPGLLAEKVTRERRTPAFPTQELDGLVWVYATPDVEPEREPYHVPRPEGAGYAHLVREQFARGSLHAVIENALDVPHTSFLHRGLFRSGERNPIQAEVRRFHDHVEAEYRGEPRPSGAVGRILSPSGGTVEHWDRFFLPSVAQVEYRLGTENHFLVTALCTPQSDFETKLFAVVSFRTRFPAAVVQRVLEPFAQRIFGQDAAILREQSENIERFGGEQFVSTELDLLGPHVWRLLRQAERGDVGAPGEPEVHQVHFTA